MPAAIFVDEFDRDQALVAVPRPEVQIVVRIGPMAHRGLDAHAMGAGQSLRRKVIRAGQRTVAARLPLGASTAILGASATALAGRIVSLEDLWGDAAVQRLLDQVAAARTTLDAGAILARTIADRADAPEAPHARLARDAANRLEAAASIADIADELGVSERHLRRVFREVVGVGPKAFARLSRFHRALGAAGARHPASWASIAVATGYYDQAHLIEEFRAIAGTTPRALLAEMSGYNFAAAAVAAAAHGPPGYSRA